MFRAASQDDLVALRDLEREASLVGLRHVFAPERYPFPDDAVLARWRLVLDDPTVRVLVLDRLDESGLVALAAYDSSTLRHLAVHPEHWGRGLATAAIDAALDGIRAGGRTSASLWCLRENHRARGLYERLGWQATGDEQEAAWPPYPVEVRYRTTLAGPSW